MVFLPSKKDLWGEKVIKIKIKTKPKINKNKKAIVLRKGKERKQVTSITVCKV